MRIRKSSINSVEPVEVWLRGQYLAHCRKCDLSDLRALERSLVRSTPLRWAVAAATAGVDGEAEVLAWLARHRPQGFGVHLRAEPGRSLRWSPVAFELARALPRLEAAAG